MTASITQIEMREIPAEEISCQEQLPIKPLVSVVMMTRNHESFIIQAVESVVGQQCDFPIELLIGEDYSSDGTRDICKLLQEKYPNLIRLIVSSENVGITKNFLRLVCRSKGSYIALLEGDDYWVVSDKLKKQVEMMEANPDYSWCGAKTFNRTFWAEEKDFFTMEDTLLRYIVHTSSIMFRSDIMETYPRFPDAVFWESMLCAYLCEYGNCGFLNEVVSYYRRHEGGLWTGADSGERISLSWIFTDTMVDYFNGNYMRILYDRELWVYKMETEIHIGKDFWKYWRKSLHIARIAFKRMIKVLPGPYLIFTLQVYLQPIVALYMTFRRKLAIRKRIESVQGIIKQIK